MTLEADDRPAYYTEPEGRYLTRLAHHKAVARPFVEKSLAFHDGDMAEALYRVQACSKNDNHLMRALLFLGAHYAVQEGVMEALRGRSGE